MNTSASSDDCSIGESGTDGDVELIVFDKSAAPQEQTQVQPLAPSLLKIKKMNLAKQH